MKQGKEKERVTEQEVRQETIFDRLLHASESFEKSWAASSMPDWLCCCWTDSLQALRLCCTLLFLIVPDVSSLTVP